MDKLKKTYYLFFYKLYLFFKSISEDGWEDWKACIVVSTLGILLIVELLVWWTIITKLGIDIPNYKFAISVGILVSGLNYYALLYRNRWKQYEEEFKHYSRKKDKAIQGYVFIFILLVLGSLVFSFSQMSLIDWSRYR